MIIDHDCWPIVALIGSTVYLDASGREAAKVFSLRKEGFRPGTSSLQRVFFASYILMALMGIPLIGYAISKLTIH